MRLCSYSDYKIEETKFVWENFTYAYCGNSDVYTRKLVYM
jgi:hypothetical protein